MDHQTNQKLQYLLTQVESLSIQQQNLQRNIAEIAREIKQLQTEEKEVTKESSLQKESFESKEDLTITQRPILPRLTQKPVIIPGIGSAHSAKAEEIHQPVVVKPMVENQFIQKSRTSIDFEKFIGENIISKIGVVILVIGVGIGAKYAIDKDLLSPLARIILGYLMGAAILFTAIRLKEKYENFSAILLGGAMAIFYLITFAAYDFYGIISQGLAFALMVIFTLFTVAASLFYNREWIALLGMVGAYGVPFLLSDGSGKVAVLFSYISLLNLGILAVAYKKYWRILYYSAFSLSWIIFLTWFGTQFEVNKHFGICLGFSTIFFFTFYGIIMLHKLVEKRKFLPEDVMFLLLNSFIYFGIGYAAISEYAPAERFAGLFTLANALVHFAIALAIYRMKLADRNLFHLVSGLVLIFLTIAIPVQLDGHWVTVIWAAEAALLYWIGRSKKVGFYEILSYPLMVLALLSQVQDWGGISTPDSYIYTNDIITPLLNTGFLMGLLVCSAFGIMMVTGKKHPTVLLNPVLKQPPPYAQFFGNIFPFAAFMLLLYFTFRQELFHFWLERYGSNNNDGESYPYYSPGLSALVLLRVWLLNYTAVFLGLCGMVLLRFSTEKITRNIYFGLSAITLLIMAGTGTFWLGDLRDSVLKPTSTGMGITKTTAISIRYISFACTAFLLFALYRLKKQIPFSLKYGAMAFDILLHLNILCAGSSELITWLKINEYAGFDKLGLSILWGVYALMLIGLGIFLNKQHLRIGAIALFAITLIKLFFYDIANLNTMSKTIVFISLGILLLIISFLYNKYKNAISGANED